MNPIYCQYCQTPLQEHASFCPGCGHETGSREAVTHISAKIPTVVLTLSEDQRTALSAQSLPHAYPGDQDNATYISEKIPTTRLEIFSENTPTTMLENVMPLAEQVDVEKDDEDDNGILFIPGIPAPTPGAPLVNGMPQINGAPSIPGTPHISAPPALSGPPQVSALPGHAPLAHIPPSAFPHGYPGPIQPGNLPLNYPNPTPPGAGLAHPGGGPGPTQPSGGPIKTGGKGCIPWVAGISLLLVLIIVLLILFPPFGSHPSVAQAQVIIASSLNSSAAYPGGSIQLHGQNFLPGGIVTFQENGQQVQTGGLTSNPTFAYQSIAALVLSYNLTQQARSFQTTATVKTDGTFDCTFSIPSTWPINSTHPVTASEHQNGKSTTALVNITVHTTPIVQATATPAVTATDTPTPIATATDTPTPTPTDTPIPTPTVPPTQAPPPPTKPVTLQRQLSAQQTQSKTVPSTGRGSTPGTQASGLLSIYNSNFETDLTLSAGTIMTNNGAACGPSTLQMVLDSAVILRPETGASYPAHVTTVGAAGNIPAQCTSDGEVEPAFVYNHCILSCDWDASSNAGAFAGGTDPQTFAVVQQSDIDTAAASLKTSTAQTATANIQSQLRLNEHLIGTPQCSYNVNADHKAGDIVGRFTVTVIATCTATAST